MATSTPAKKRGQTASAKKKSYAEDDIDILEGLEPVRKRPGMYIGGTDSEALSHLLWEIIDNAVDEAAEGHAKKVDVVAHTDGSWSVRDDGRGIPIGKHKDRDYSTVEVVFTELHAGGKFNTASYAAAGGLHGVGASVVNALSARVRIEVSKKTAVHRLDFVEQVAGQYDDTSGKFSKGHPLKRVGKPPAGHTGTWVRFWPDLQMFTVGASIAWDDAVERLKRTAWLLQGVEFNLADESGEHDPVRIVAEKGIEDALDYLRGNKEALCNPIWCIGDHSFPQNVPDGPGGKIIEVIRPCHVEVVLQWTKSFADEVVVSFVNTIPTPDGGTHITGFERAISNQVREEVKAARKENKLSKIGKLKGATSQLEDAMRGLVAVVRVVIPEPQFHGQTKRELGTAEATEIVQETVRASLKAWFAGELKGSRKSHVNAVLSHIGDAMLARHAAAEATAAQRKISKAASGGMPAKLTDCKHHPGGELLIVEGDSAAGPAKQARDTGWQAVLPLRGKPINAADSSATPAKVLLNEEVASFVTAMGAGSGKTFSLDAARYDRVVLLADADVDGAHIRCLLLTLMWHHMRPLLEQGRVYAAQPPTHAVTLTASGEKTFVYSDKELERHLKKVERGNRKYRITRFKGLGEMNNDELASTTLDRDTRVLRRLTVKDAEACAQIIDVLMGSDTSARREFITTHSAEYGHAIDV